MSLDSIFTTKVEDNPSFYFQKVISEPDSLLQVTTLFHQTFPNLKECTCFTIERSIRVALETELLSQIKKDFPDSKALLKLVSFGSGQCFQETVLLTKLTKEGYEAIELTVVDPDYDKSRLPVDQLQKYVDQVLSSKTKVTLKVATDIEKYLESVEKKESASPDVLLLIDLQDDLIHTHGKTVLEFCSEKIILKRKLFSPASLIAFTNYKEKETGSKITTCNIYPWGAYCLPFMRTALLSTYSIPELRTWPQKYAVCILDKDEKISYRT